MTQPNNNDNLVIVNTTDEKEIHVAYQILEKYFNPSELESEQGIVDRTVCEQKDNVKHGVLLAYREGRPVCACTYDAFPEENFVYVAYIATEKDERRNHVATALLQKGIFEQFDSDILIDIVDPKKMGDAPKEEVDYVCSKSKFWSKQGAKKLGLKNFQQPDFEAQSEDEDNVVIDDGSFLAIIPRDGEITEIDAGRLERTLHLINTDCNDVENPEEAFVEMFQEVRQSPTISVSSKPLAEEVMESIQEVEVCQ